ncbi:MAG: Crp/Fnr family transcriptional regulator [Wenzhouxiangella sp.]|jgi:CRP/FNR family transcriptional regulator|nr:Crp/Fnr family transcriptional regulator [Wenzhouxiangella sp.]
MSTQWTQRFIGFSRLSETVRTTLEQTSRIRRFRAGRRVFGPGESPPGMLFLIEGTVRVHQQGDNGRDIVLYRVSGGESCVMTTACHFTHLNYYAEGIAETDVVAAEVPRQVFDDLVKDSPEFRDFVLTAYSHRIVDLFRLIDDVVFGRMDLRIAARLLQLADGDGEVRVTHQALADELGTAREVVSRQISEFQKRGWIEQGRGRVRLLDTPALERFAAAG